MDYKSKHTRWQLHFIISKVLFVSYGTVSETGMHFKTDGILDLEKFNIIISSIKESNMSILYQRDMTNID